jgi:hyperosmotically inducible protein
MRFSIRHGTSLSVLTVCIAVASSTLSVDTFAQAALSSAHMTRVALRSANHKMERDVRKVLDDAKLDSSNLRVVTRSGKVTLDGTVLDASQIQLANSVASSVHGVSSVSNMLLLQTQGH